MGAAASVASPEEIRLRVSGRSSSEPVGSPLIPTKLGPLIWASDFGDTEDAYSNWSVPFRITRCSHLFFESWRVRVFFLALRHAAYKYVGDMPP